ncbi:hypothetical protein BGZ76_001109 [Entomortierella beljakovae]|nr:hypothetical protein BGZ76_001109 [Entomortierella beljakovae]
MVSFKGLFQSESQRQVEAEARNIGLAHTIRDLITGSNHEIHVDSYQKKKAVKALQKADPAQVNDLISILKAMPDPTVVEFKTVHSRDPSKHHNQKPEDAGPSTPPSDNTSDGDNSTNDNDKGKQVDNNEPEVIKPPSSWWAISFASLLSSFTPAIPTEDPSITTTTTTVTTIETTEEEAEKPTDTTEATDVEVTTSSSTELVKKVETVEGKTAGKTGTITKTTTSSTTVSEPAIADKSVVVSTLNSIKQQIAALGKSPPTHMISAYTYWWGYEIYVPHKCMSKLQRVSNTSQIFFGFLSGAITGIPGLASLVPLTRIISAWVGFQWAVIRAEDVGKGVVLSATWVLPVALAPRSWDHPGNEDDPAPVPNPKQKKIKAA